jgi:hypothetical protein
MGPCGGAGVAEWAAAGCEEAASLTRLARCAAALVRQLPGGAGKEAAAAAAAQLRATFGLEGSTAAGALAAAGHERLPFECAAAAALAHLLRELGHGTPAAKALVADLLLHRTQRCEGGGAAAAPTLPQVLAAVAAWPAALAWEGGSACSGVGPQGAAAPVDWREAAARAPTLAALHAALFDACCAAAASGGRQKGGDSGRSCSGEDVAAAAALLEAGPSWWGPCWALGRSGDGGALAAVVASAEQALLQELGAGDNSFGHSELWLEDGLSGALEGGEGRLEGACAVLQLAQRLQPGLPALSGALGRVQAAADHAACGAAGPAAVAASQVVSAAVGGLPGAPGCDVEAF